ncbi:MAG: diversity-generating retroelement protein Avd [Pyrinomonadaceae bacterium]
MKSQIPELTVIQKTYDLILWWVPIIDRFPRSHKYGLGARIENLLYQILEELVAAKFEKSKTERLSLVNIKLEVLRHQARLLLDLKVFDGKKLHYVTELINGVGREVGGWLRQQRATA